MSWTKIQAKRSNRARKSNCLKSDKSRPSVGAWLLRSQIHAPMPSWLQLLESIQS
jgi:hypothetical protein